MKDIESTARQTSSAFNYNTPLDSSHLLQYRLTEEKKVLVSSLIRLQNQRTSLHEEMGKPNIRNLRKWRGKESKHKHGAVLKEYLSVGESIWDISARLAEIRESVDSQVPLDFQNMFVDIAKQLLTNDDFYKVLKYTTYRHNELLDMLVADKTNE